MKMFPRKHCMSLKQRMKAKMITRNQIQGQIRVGGREMETAIAPHESSSSRKENCLTSHLRVTVEGHSNLGKQKHEIRAKT